MILAWLIAVLLFAQEALPQPAQEPVQEEEEALNIGEIIFEHIGDEYNWHIATLGTHHVVLHLPVIVHSSTGWHVFSSRHLEEGPYQGLALNEEGKIIDTATGKRPLDISVTKNVVALLFSALLIDRKSVV